MAAVAQPTEQNADDIDLVAAVRAGDDRAFEQLYTRYEGRIGAYVRGMVRDHGRAEDITQEVFISALRRMRDTDREIAFKPWIYEIAKNACIDAFRRARNMHEVSFDVEGALTPSDQRRLSAPGSSPDAIVDTKLALDDLCGAFGGLSQTHHDILVMREFEGLSYREIGERLGMSRAAVESTLFRARRRLSEEYEELVSGERCLRVRGIVDTRSARLVGLRDQRRMARHISHCQPCRRYACLAGVDLAAVRAPASVGARIAALLPLPAFLRRRDEGDAAGSLLGHHPVPGLQWSSNLVNVLDPALVSGWSKAVATAAAVAVAGLGAGAAVGERKAVSDAVSRGPAAVLGLSSGDPSASDRRSPAGAPESAATPLRGRTQSGIGGRSGQRANAPASPRPSSGTAGVDPAKPGATLPLANAAPDTPASDTAEQGLGLPAPLANKLGVDGARNGAPDAPAAEPKRPVQQLLDRRDGGAGGASGDKPARPNVLQNLLPGVGANAPSGANGPAIGASGTANGSSLPGPTSGATATPDPATPPAGSGELPKKVIDPVPGVVSSVLQR